MAEKQKEIRYQVQCEEESTEAPQQSNQLQEDPLDNLPELSEQSGGLPVVAFILVCLSAFAVFLMRRAATADSLLVLVCCVAMAGIMLFGMAALVRGMFRRLHDQRAAQHWFPISAGVMAAALILGAVVGIFFC